jgi:hypothetical protein
MASDAAKNIEALTEGVRKQREIAKEALDAVKKIDLIVQQTSDPDMKRKLEATKEDFLKVTRELVANASSSTSALESTFDLISNLPKR